jgi:hypothetical protein
MSIDDLAQTAAAQLRDTSARTFDVESSLASIPSASRRRTRTQQSAALATVTVLILVGWLALRPAPVAAPGPIGTPSPIPTASHTSAPRPAGPATLLYPLCYQPQQYPSGNFDRLPTCRSSQRAGLYASALRYPKPALGFTLALPASWTAVGGWPAYPKGSVFFPQGSTTFAAAGDVQPAVTGLSLINRDGTAGIVLQAEPSVVCDPPATCLYTGTPPEDLVGFLRDRSGTATVRPTVVGGLPASIVELAPSVARIDRTTSGCHIPHPCQGLVGYYIPENGEASDGGIGGTAAPTMGRLEQHPSRVIVVGVPHAGRT